MQEHVFRQLDELQYHLIRSFEVEHYASYNKCLKRLQNNRHQKYAICLGEIEYLQNCLKNFLRFEYITPDVFEKYSQYIRIGLLQQEKSA